MKLFAELRDLVFDRLTGSIAKTSGGGFLPIYDDVPASPTLPYAALEDHTWQADDTDTSEGGDFVLAISVFSKYRGSKEAAQYASAIRDRLNRQESQFTPAGFALVAIDVTEVTAGLEGDATTRAARLSVRLKIDDIITQSY